jgi:hypothetical protein
MRIAVIATAYIMTLVTVGVPGGSEGIMVIKGTVIDEGTQRPLAFAQVQVLGTQRRAATDSAGRYQIDSIKFEDVSVQARALGYTREIREVVAPFPPHVVCGGECKPWKPVVVLNFYMRRTPVAEY